MASCNVIKNNFANLSRVLSVSRETLFSLSSLCYEVDLIDLPTKTSIITSNSLVGAHALLDHLQLKAEQSKDYLKLILELLGKETALKEIVESNEACVQHQEAYKRRNEGNEVKELQHRDAKRKTSNKAAIIAKAEQLQKNFSTLVFLMIKALNVDLTRLKVVIQFFLQHAHHDIPNVQSLSDSLQRDTHTTEEVFMFLVSRNILGYLNFGVLNQLEHLIDDVTVIEKFEAYKTQHNDFICSNFSIIVQIFQDKPRLAPASVVGLPEITVELEEPWKERSLYEWNEILKDNTEWPDYLMIKEIHFSNVVIRYYVMPFILSRVVTDLTDAVIVKKFAEVGATFHMSSEVQRVGREGSQWIRNKVNEAFQLLDVSSDMKKSLSEDADAKQSLATAEEWAMKVAARKLRKSGDVLDQQVQNQHLEVTVRPSVWMLITQKVSAISRRICIFCLNYFRYGVQLVTVQSRIVISSLQRLHNYILPLQRQPRRDWIQDTGASSQNPVMISVSRPVSDDITEEVLFGKSKSKTTEEASFID